MIILMKFLSTAASSSQTLRISDINIEETLGNMFDKFVKLQNDQDFYKQKKMVKGNDFEFSEKK